MTTFLWIMTFGFILGCFLGIIFGIFKKTVLAITAICLAFICAICFIINITVEPVKNVGNATGIQKNKITYIEGVEFPEIYKAYKENELRADEKYKNNRYRITAKINGMSTDGLLNISGGATLTMELKVENTIVIFYAKFDKNQEESLKTINVGDTITFEGKCLSAGSWSECKLIVD